MTSKTDDVREAVARIEAALQKADDIGVTSTLFWRSGPDLRMDDIRTAIAALSTAEPAPVASASILSATDRACYEYPGEDQADLRAAYVESATAGASAEVLRATIRAWLDADDPSHWGEFEKRLDAAIEEPAPAALDEGAAGEAVAWERLRTVGTNIGWVPVDPEDIPHYKSVGQEIRPLYTHPSTPPAAQDDRLRIAVEALEAAREVIETFRDKDLLAEGVHTGLRKGTDAKDAHALWTVISDSDTSAWSDAFAFALAPYFSMWGGDAAVSKIDEALAALNPEVAK